MHAARNERFAWESVLTGLVETRLSELDLVLTRLELAAAGSAEAAFLEAEERRLLRLLGPLTLAPAEVSA